MTEDPTDDEWTGVKRRTHNRRNRQNVSWADSVKRKRREERAFAHIFNLKSNLKPLDYTVDVLGRHCCLDHQARQPASKLLFQQWMGP